MGTSRYPGKTLAEAKKAAKKSNVRTRAEQKRYKKMGEKIPFDYNLISTGKFEKKMKNGNGNWYIFKTKKK